MTDISGNRTKYRISNASKRYWDKATPVVVQQSTDGGATWSTVPATDYTVAYVGGEVTFTTARPSGAQIRVSGAYYNVTQVGGFFEWSLDIERQVEDATTFESNGWSEGLPTLLSASGSASRYWATSNEFFSLLGQEVILVLYVDKTSNKRYEGYFRITTQSVETAVDSLIEESLDFQLTGELYYREN